MRSVRSRTLNKLSKPFPRKCVDFVDYAQFQSDIPGFPGKRVNAEVSLTRPAKRVKILYSFRYDNVSRVPSSGRDKKSEGHATLNVSFYIQFTFVFKSH